MFLVLPLDIANVALPEGVEEEEDVGQVVDQQEEEEVEIEIQRTAGDQEEFLIEVNQIENMVDGKEDSENAEEEEFEESEGEESEDETPPAPPPQVLVNRRGRKITPNAMIGEVRKGKYSASSNVEKCKAIVDNKRKR